ncbi:MAG: triose-phosphate isomerase [Bacteroidales bacterium]|jgi:triosephosphate isomerase|nr:triose-phosphate isomerase [Bacteroidales bacterium]MDY0316054.1 triose-phosphate isomerase [Bacteroidales bacterium]NLB86210.1 triose-phosphate isomerase [Bacteroidales bacterium]
MRKKIVAGNWKMNTLPNEGVELAKTINEYVKTLNQDEKYKVILGVPFTHIDKVVQAVDLNLVSVSAQDCAMYESGAYTGEVSAKMIKSANCEYAIIGHSERRQYFGDTDEVIAKKLEMCYNNDLFPILCCGEKLEERENNSHFEVVEKQILNALINVNSEKMQNTIIAYEPVWAIGTGKTASPEQAQEMHEFIRKILSEKYGEEIANTTSILYGGSVNSKNAKQLFSNKDIDGGLVGGASLKSEEFIAIINAIRE